MVIDPLIVIGVVYSWVASGVRTFTHPAEVLTGIPIIVVAVLLVRGRRARNVANDHPARWLTGWSVLALSLFAWEMHELFSSPRHDYPTMSSIGDAVLRSSRVTHAVAFAIWLALGGYLTQRAWARRTS